MSFFMRVLTMFLGYIYPAYKCFKSIEQKQQDKDEQTFWCRYWVLIAVITFVERITDVMISWIPMYNEAKLAFIVYLWYPKTKGTNYIYSTFLKPFVVNYEPELDRRLSELKSQAGGMARLGWKRVSDFTQEKFLETIHCLTAPQIRLQAYRHFSQLQPPEVEEIHQPASPPNYYDQILIQEEAVETKSTTLPVRPITQAARTEFPTSPMFRTSRSGSRLSYIRA